MLKKVCFFVLLLLVVMQYAYTRERYKCPCYGLTSDRKEFSIIEDGYRLDDFDIDYRNTGVFMHVRVKCDHHAIVFMVYPDAGTYEGYISD